MSSITPHAVRMALADFIDQRVLSAIGSDNSSIKWLIGGAATLFLARFESMYAGYKPLLNSFGVINESGNFELEEIIKFINSAFEKQSEVKMNVLGTPFVFDKADGDAFIQFLRSKGA